MNTPRRLLGRLGLETCPLCAGLIVRAGREQHERVHAANLGFALTPDAEPATTRSDHHDSRSGEVDATAGHGRLRRAV